MAPVLPVLEVDAADGVASSVGKPNRSAASSKLSSSADDVFEGAGAEGAADDVPAVAVGVGLDQRPELDAVPAAATVLSDCAAGARDAAVEADGAGAAACVADGPADAELAGVGAVTGAVVGEEIGRAHV